MQRKSRPATLQRLKLVRRYTNGAGCVGSDAASSLEKCGTASFIEPLDMNRIFRPLRVIDGETIANAPTARAKKLVVIRRSALWIRLYSLQCDLLRWI